ncbi:hypothetical protein GDO81_005928 [Engystomops pustulosus]|uniref:c-Myc-binding protein n=1 Tax=Engystomops pustulosus TaxID=76066 RepID=A0AAV7CT24_ENGPU|nr:hypothetical protein GDO81_005928 [Engystomops pustulosus]
MEDIAETSLRITAGLLLLSPFVQCPLTYFFLKQHMGAAGPETPDVEALRLEIAELKQKYEAVLEENKELKAKLAQLEPHTDEKRPE